MRTQSGGRMTDRESRADLQLHGEDEKEQQRAHRWASGAKIFRPRWQMRIILPLNCSAWVWVGGVTKGRSDLSPTGCPPHKVRGPDFYLQRGAVGPPLRRPACWAPTHLEETRLGLRSECVRMQ